MVVGQDNIVLHTTFGKYSKMAFPEEYIRAHHERFPGLIRLMAHTHPPGMNYLSKEDRMSLKAWTYAHSPYPIFMEVICRVGGGIFRGRYWYHLEPLLDWEERKRKLERYKIVPKREIHFHECDISDCIPTWVEQILMLSEEL